MDHNHEKVFDIILIIGLVILIVAFLQMNSGRITVAKNRMSECIQDSDCTLVNSGCCGCNAGGEKTSVNKYYIGYWNENLSASCRDISCPAVESKKLSCYAEAKCVNNICNAVTSL
jgi:hypothetical protein